MAGHKSDSAARDKAKALKAAEAELRDDFAARLGAASFPVSHDDAPTVAAWATKAYTLADALLVARSAEPEAPAEEAK